MMRRALALLVLACAAARRRAPLRRRSRLGDLDEVMGLLAMRQHGRVEFIEQHFLAVLSHPIESSGELRYDAPDHLEKRTLQPRPESLVLDGGALTVERDGHRRVMDLHATRRCSRSSKAFAPPWRAIASALERVFRLEFAGSVERWTLTLVPLDRRSGRPCSRCGSTARETNC